ncbi:hypothetical protein N867_10960 [Actinotalea fermentans ATCC 43279 = JCM 9966 = DSM 3133]|uniref:GGDEF-domain containing protein n=1 Tax=Actinotalea fermentans TaxID=43671 RepID=A0A511YUJ9_9CELL|nr:hypothetical protein N867_10960 [Actinotalea fermentans ATCC 43279 = JCM 9966 = DSM 3133]GEN78865.1 hypothetical protein AFE02nite_05990 [Actinotalea fermentans]
MPSWLTVLQCLVAGVVVGLVAMETGAWRGELRRSGVRWGSAWSLALAGVCLLNGLYGVLAPGPHASGLLFARFVAYAAAIVLALPAVRAYTGGPGVRRFGTVLLAWFAAAGVLWWTSPLILAGIDADGVPSYGPLLPLAELVPVVVLGVYVFRAVRGLEVTTAGACVAGGAVVAVVALVGGAVAPASWSTEPLRGLWVVPLVAGLEVLAAARVRAVRRAADRRARMRDAIASVSNAAWLAHTPAELLETARAQCEELLHDPSIRGTLRPLSRDRFVTEFYSAEGRALLPDEQSFLRDVARVVSSAAERHTLTSKLRDAAYTDALTGLHNRPALDRQLAAALGKAEVESTRVAVLLCDLDNFKHANDMRGREWGDRLLRRVAAQLVDAAGPGAFVARHGGDDFVVVVERAPDDTELLALARRVQGRFEYLAHRVPATPMTVGVAAWRPGEVRDVDALVRGADLAMIAAKRGSKGAAFYDDLLRGEFHERTTMRRELEEAMSAGDIVVHFQPLTDTGTLEVVGLEALARWRRNGELVLPQEWLPLAEETGLIVEIGRQVFAAARNASEKYDLPVAVNVAARQLDEADFVRHVEQSWGPGAWRRLTIEVTESALLHDDAHARAALATLAARGARIALDDFGTGYNSLSRLAELPVHVIKVDRSFVHASGTPEGDAVLRAVLAVARAHGLDVVAEGVERAEELTTLVGMGVDTVQGFMLGRPAPTLPIRGRRPGTGEIEAVTPERLPQRLPHQMSPAAGS